MALRGGQRGQPVRVNAPVARFAAKADPVYGWLQLPSAGHLLSEHLPPWDEWSSPGELIHPGDSPRTSSTVSGAAKNYLRVGYSQPHSHVWPRPGSFCRRGRAVRIGKRSVTLRVCRKGIARPARHLPLAIRSVWKQMPTDRRFAMRIVGQEFSADKTLRVALFARCGLVVVLTWFGATKFTRSESHGISPLTVNSPTYRDRCSQPADKR
jgi:hypothetical protein